MVNLDVNHLTFLVRYYIKCFCVLMSGIGEGKLHHE